jgi:hypothetical protein
VAVETGKTEFSMALIALATVASLQLEFRETWPELAVHSDGAAVRFVLPGAISSNWQSDKQRRATTIAGTALIRCVRDFFGEEK